MYQSNGFNNVDKSILFMIDETSSIQNNGIQLNCKEINSNCTEFFFTNVVIWEWNKLPPSLLQCNSTNYFKNDLSSHPKMCFIIQESLRNSCKQFKIPAAAWAGDEWQAAGRRCKVWRPPCVPRLPQTCQWYRYVLFPCSPRRTGEGVSRGRLCLDQVQMTSKIIWV